MKGGGLSRATICANSEARAVRAHLNGSAIDMRVDYLEDWSPRGAAGCVRDAGIKTDADTFVVADGTSVPVVDLEELLEAHQAAGAALTVVVGADAAGRLRPSGVYVFDRWSFDFIPEDGFQDIKEKLIPRLYGAGEHVSTHMARAVAPRVVNTDTYLALNQWAVERALARPGPGGRLPCLGRRRGARERGGGPERPPARPRAPRPPGVGPRGRHHRRPRQHRTRDDRGPWRRRLAAPSSGADASSARAPSWTAACWPTGRRSSPAARPSRS